MIGFYAAALGNLNATWLISRVYVGFNTTEIRSVSVAANLGTNLLNDPKTQPLILHKPIFSYRELKDTS